jgi:hypothetical protein
MRLRLAGIGAVVAALALSQIGAAAPERDQLIRMHEGIGKVRLGMTIAQVRRALGGRHQVVYRRKNFGWDGRYVEFGWERPGRTWSEPTLWRVGFRSRTRRGTPQVVRVMTTARSQRTPEGFGVGSRSRKVARAYPRTSCVTRYGSPHPGAWIVVEGPPGAAMTAFRVDDKESGFKSGKFWVISVMVQERWFSKGGYPYHTNCGFGWKDW